MNSIEMPTQAGAYRWYYVDVSNREMTVVAIFMLGSLFSPRYSRSSQRRATPREHSAVNFVVYENRSRRTWVLTEYPNAVVENSNRLLRIGGSTLEYTSDKNLVIHISEKTPFWRKHIQATIELQSSGLGHPPLRLINNLEHFWHPIAPFARARVTLNNNVSFEGRGYHDSNNGNVVLGRDLEGWSWHRNHRNNCTLISFRPWHAASREYFVASDETGTRVKHNSADEESYVRSRWGLRMPVTLATHRRLESSPFYARTESSDDTSHSLAEVADFRRFHSPLIRWMAHFKTRYEKARP